MEVKNKFRKFGWVKFLSHRFSEEVPEISEAPVSCRRFLGPFDETAPLAGRRRHKSRTQRRGLIREQVDTGARRAMVIAYDSRYGVSLR
jgi:hypothetical protein